MKLALVEVFASPQGEGYNSGRAAIFVRFAGCPLACQFADGAVCDTPYQQANHKLTIEELFSELVFPLRAKLGAERPETGQELMLVLTGGEPTMSPAFDETVTFAKRLGFYLAVETNGMKWRDGLRMVNWITVSPKVGVKQTSRAEHHNHAPHAPTLHPMITHELSSRVISWIPSVRGPLLEYGGEYRYVIGERETPMPPWHDAPRHYVSPAVNSDGSGQEWKTSTFPGFAWQAVERCLEIVSRDPRWRISLQTHKLIGVR